MEDVDPLGSSNWNIVRSDGNISKDQITDAKSCNKLEDEMMAIISWGDRVNETIGFTKHNWQVHSFVDEIAL